MSVSLCVWHAMGAVLSWFTFHLSGFLLETVDIFKRCAVSKKFCHSQFIGQSFQHLFVLFSSVVLLYCHLLTSVLIMVFAGFKQEKMQTFILVLFLYTVSVSS